MSTFSEVAKEQINRVAHVLWAANTAPLAKDEFYQLKTAICESIGTCTGKVVQRIDYPCWRCGGRGGVCDYSGFEDVCWKCGGDGIFDSVFIELTQWRVGKHVFLQPIRRLSFDERRGRSTAIVGHVPHKQCPWSPVANLAIGRLFDRSYYWLCGSRIRDECFGLSMRQCERLCEWAFGERFRRMSPAIPAALPWLESQSAVTTSLFPF